MRKPIPLVITSVFTFIRIPPPKFPFPRTRYGLVIWDTQTGVITTQTSVNTIQPFTSSLSEVVFSGDQKTVTLICGTTFLMYDGLKGTKACEGRLPSDGFGAHWIYEESLRYATISTFDGVINIYELRPTSAPLFSLVESFPVPSHDAGFSFSPVPFHVSFIMVEGVLIIDVRDSKILLQVDTAELLYTSPGYFSPDGLFFACGTYEKDRICVWKNTPTGYTPWSHLKLRLPFEGFSFSPASISILSWSSRGIQLLHPDNRLNPPSPSGVGPRRQPRGHLVAYSASGAHIAIARRSDSRVVILNPRSGTLRQPIDTGALIWDIRIVEDTIFVADGHKLVSWNLEAGGMEDETVAIGARGKYLTLSHDCSQIAFADDKTVFLYDVKAQKILENYAVDMEVIDIRLSPNQHGIQLIMRSLLPNPFKPPRSPTDRGLLVPDPEYLTAHKRHEECSLGRLFPGDSVYYFMELEMKDEGFVINAPRERLGSTRPIGCHLQSHGYRVGSRSGWVEDSRGGKLLWLPPSWRTVDGLDIKWDGNFLALVGGQHTAPIIIEFQPPLAPSPATL